ncbi:MAG: methyltransferase domain-containing protein [Gemmatimonadetes bacterium]|nr:methyltransferase domain-containing protein [Gemmatimonadota bacterium]
MTVLEARTPLHVPDLHVFEEAGLSYAIDPTSPNWVAVEHEGRWLLEAISATPGVTFGELLAGYATTRAMEPARAWVAVRDFLRALARAGMLQTQPFVREPYPGRSALVAPDGLRELWIQINNACNLSCAHCLVSSGPGQDKGPPLDFLRAVVNQASELGLERLYLTGGEPFVRKDLFDLLRHATEDRGLEAIVLTNATVFRGAVRAGLATLDRQRVRFQVSIDGARPETSDAIRGPGTFAAAVNGASLLADLGFDVSMTTVTTRRNLAELPELPALALKHGAKSQHLMWTHKRGRAAASLNGFFPDVPDVLAAVLHTADAADRAGIPLDNVEVVKRRVNGVPGVKYDLGNGGWDSLCVSFDGKVYPTAALANTPALVCGDACRAELATILRRSPVIRALRAATVARKPEAAADPFRFFTGGGDWEHAWAFSGGDILAPDPYYPIQLALVKRVMTALGTEKQNRKNLRSGYGAPLVLHAMGEGAIACGTADGALAERPVLTLHSNCVLSFDVDKPRAKVREYYGAAAEQPQPDLCCPTKYEPDLVAHIPTDVLDRFYGCGSPIAAANVQPGETVLDLGSGAGIDVFIAARLVGPTGRAIGVDMTDAMLAVANQCKPDVAAALGYDVAEFHKGYLEQIPLEARSVDLITSNCVVNLSPDKPRVFEEMWRVLRDHGRIVIADIVSEREVPPHLKVNPQLWGECLVGALTEEEFLAQLERAGFYGLTVLKKTYWKDVEDYPFFSITVQGFKHEKSAGCVYRGHRAVYLGPAKAFMDEEGHLFPRNEPTDICTDTVARLGRPPYQAMFAILQPGEQRAGYACCGPEGDCC